jgi:hypothetical protein
MSVDSIVRVSFQSGVKATQAANRALVGHADKDAGRDPFRRVAQCTRAPTVPMWRWAKQ